MSLAEEDWEKVLFQSVTLPSIDQVRDPLEDLVRERGPFPFHGAVLAPVADHTEAVVLFPWED